MSDHTRLKRLLCPKLPQKGVIVTLSADEAHHATRVLRLRNGDIVEVLDGNGNKIQATLRLRGEFTELEFFNSVDPEPNLHKANMPFPFILEMAVLKGEAMEWVVEKAVELGVLKLVPVLTAHTVVQMKTKGPELFRERWQKIADQALKQCGRLDRMDISLPISLENLLSLENLPTNQNQSPSWSRLWCDEASQAESPYLLNWLFAHPPQKGSLLKVLIGPEGGWSSSERTLLNLQSQVSPQHRIHLGPLILRAETAALFSISVISAHARTEDFPKN